MPVGIHHTSPDEVFGRLVSREDSATSKPLSPFVPASRFITPTDDGRVATALPRNLSHRGETIVRAFARNTARFPPSSTQATLPHNGFSRQLPAATSTRLTKPGTGLPTPEAAVVPALASVFDSKVTLLGRLTARSLVGTCRLPTGRTFPALSRRISPYETRSWGYRSHGDVRASATSPWNLTGKPSLTYSVGPFVVELFTAIGFADGRRESQSRSRLSPDGSSPRQPR